MIIPHFLLILRAKCKDMIKSLPSVMILFTSVIVLSCKNGSGSQMKGDAGIAFVDTIIEFGELEFSGEGEDVFVFANNGNAPLLITHVKSTCGCTIPEWSKEPVNPGDTGRIQVSYDTHRIGQFKKSIYVYSNAAGGARRLHISGEVLRPEESEIL